AGSYELVASREGLVAPEPRALTLGPLDAASADVSLVAGGSIAGTVAGRRSRLARLTVRATQAGGAAVTARVDEEGRFRLSGLARGPWRLRLEPTLLDDLTVDVVP